MCSGGGGAGRDLKRRDWAIWLLFHRKYQNWEWNPCCLYFWTCASLPFSFVPKNNSELFKSSSLFQPSLKSFLVSVKVL